MKNFVQKKYQNETDLCTNCWPVSVDIEIQRHGFQRGHSIDV